MYYIEMSKNRSARRSGILLSAARNNTVGANVLSHLAAEHGKGKGITGFFSPEQLAELRLISVGFKEAVGLAPINDVTTIVEGSLEAWRKSFPKAKAINISGREDLVDADFIHLNGLETVIMKECTGITDAAFVHLKGIQHLDMESCDQEGITNAAFVHLKGIHTLNMSHCNQAGITDAAFVHLKGIHTLNMSWCNQAGITDAAFVHLKGIHTLDVSWFNTAGITRTGSLCDLRQANIIGVGGYLECPTLGGTRKGRSHRRKSTKKSSKRR